MNEDDLQKTQWKRTDPDGTITKGYVKEEIPLTTGHTTVDKVHMPVTAVLALAVPFLLFMWNAQADDIDKAHAVAASNASSITVLINENNQRKEDIDEVKEAVKANGIVARSVERTLIKIAVKLKIDEED